jgi:hypothetical protein
VTHGPAPCGADILLVVLERRLSGALFAAQQLRRMLGHIAAEVCGVRIQRGGLGHRVLGQPLGSILAKQLVERVPLARRVVAQHCRRHQIG